MPSFLNPEEDRGAEYDAPVVGTADPTWAEYDAPPTTADQKWDEYDAQATADPIWAEYDAPLAAKPSPEIEVHVPREATPEEVRKSLLDEKTAEVAVSNPDSAWGKTWAAFTRGHARQKLSELHIELAARGDIDGTNKAQAMKDEFDSLSSKNPIKGERWLATQWYKAANSLGGGMLESIMREMAIYGVAVGVTALATNVPDPSDVITTPAVWLGSIKLARTLMGAKKAAKAAGLTRKAYLAARGVAGVTEKSLRFATAVHTLAGAASAAATTYQWGKVGASDIFSELKDAPVDHNVKLFASAIGGTVYGAIENIAGIHKMNPAFAAADKFLEQNISKGVMKAVLAAVGRYGMEVVKEMTEEGLQEGTVTTTHNIVVARWLDKEIMKELEMTMSSPEAQAIPGSEQIRRSWDAFKDSFGPMLILGAPGGAIDAKRSAVAASQYVDETTSGTKAEQFIQEMSKYDDEDFGKLHQELFDSEWTYHEEGRKAGLERHNPLGVSPSVVTNFDEVQIVDHTTGVMRMMTPFEKTTAKLIQVMSRVIGGREAIFVNNMGATMDAEGNIGRAGVDGMSGLQADFYNVTDPTKWSMQLFLHEGVSHRIFKQSKSWMERGSSQIAQEIVKARKQLETAQASGDSEKIAELEKNLKRHEESQELIKTTGTEVREAFDEILSIIDTADSTGEIGRERERIRAQHVAIGDHQEKDPEIINEEIRAEVYESMAGKAEFYEEILNERPGAAVKLMRAIKAFFNAFSRLIEKYTIDFQRETPSDSGSFSDEQIVKIFGSDLDKAKNSMISAVNKFMDARQVVERIESGMVVSEDEKALYDETSQDPGLKSVRLFGRPRLEDDPFNKGEAGSAKDAMSSINMAMRKNRMTNDEIVKAQYKAVGAQIFDAVGINRETFEASMIDLSLIDEKTPDRHTVSKNLPSIGSALDWITMAAHSGTDDSTSLAAAMILSATKRDAFLRQKLANTQASMWASSDEADWMEGVGGVFYGSSARNPSEKALGAGVIGLRFSDPATMLWEGVHESTHAATSALFELLPENDPIKKYIIELGGAIRQFNPEFDYVIRDEPLTYLLSDPNVQSLLMSMPKGTLTKLDNRLKVRDEAFHEGLSEWGYFTRIMAKMIDPDFASDEMVRPFATAMQMIAPGRAREIQDDFDVILYSLADPYSADAKKIRETAAMDPRLAGTALVDNDGLPQVFFHGTLERNRWDAPGTTGAPFASFEPHGNTFGIHAGTVDQAEDVLDRYAALNAKELQYAEPSDNSLLKNARIVPFFVDARDVAYYDGDFDGYIFKDIVSAMGAMKDKDGISIWGKNTYAWNKFSDIVSRSGLVGDGRAAITPELSQQLSSLLEEMGYDAIKYENYTEGAKKARAQGVKNESIVILNPENIVPAYDVGNPSSKTSLPMSMIPLFSLRDDNSRFRELTKTWTPVLARAGVASIDRVLSGELMKPEELVGGKVMSRQAALEEKRFREPSPMEYQEFTVKAAKNDAGDWRLLVSDETGYARWRDAASFVLGDKSILDAGQRKVSDIPAAWAAWRSSHPAEYAELEKMRADVLKKQGYTVGPVYHGLGEPTLEGNAFDNKRLGKNQAGGPFVKESKEGHWFTSDMKEAEQYANGGPVLAVYLKDVKLASEGLFGELHYFTNKPSNIKSADVSPDSKGRIPPPSEWGDDKNDNILFSIRYAQKKDLPSDFPDGAWEVANKMVNGEKLSKKEEVVAKMLVRSGFMRIAPEKTKKPKATTEGGEERPVVEEVVEQQPIAFYVPGLAQHKGDPVRMLTPEKALGIKGAKPLSVESIELTNVDTGEKKSSAVITNEGSTTARTIRIIENGAVTNLSHAEWKLPDEMAAIDKQRLVDRMLKAEKGRIKVKVGEGWDEWVNHMATTKSRMELVRLKKFGRYAHVDDAQLLSEIENRIRASAASTLRKDILSDKQLLEDMDERMADSGRLQTRKVKIYTGIKDRNGENKFIEYDFSALYTDAELAIGARDIAALNQLVTKEELMARKYTWQKSMIEAMGVAKKLERDAQVNAVFEKQAALESERTSIDFAPDDNPSVTAKFDPQANLRADVEEAKSALSPAAQRQLERKIKADRKRVNKEAVAEQENERSHAREWLVELNKNDRLQELADRLIENDPDAAVEFAKSGDPSWLKGFAEDLEEFADAPVQDAEEGEYSKEDFTNAKIIIALRLNPSSDFVRRVFGDDVTLKSVREDDVNNAARITSKILGVVGAVRSDAELAAELSNRLLTMGNDLDIAFRDLMQVYSGKRKMSKDAQIAYSKYITHSLLARDLAGDSEKALAASAMIGSLGTEAGRALRQMQNGAASLDPDTISAFMSEFGGLGSLRTSGKKPSPVSQRDAAVTIEEQIINVINRHFDEKFSGARMPSSQKLMDMKSNMLQKIWDSAGGKPTSRADLDFRTLPDRADYVRTVSVHTAGSTDKLLEWWKSMGLLSAPSTLLQNPISNSLRFLYEYLPKRAAMNVIQAPSGGSQAELRFQWGVIMQVQKEALRAAKMAWRTEFPIWTRAGHGSKIDPDTRNFSINKLGGAVRFPFRTLSAADEYFKTVIVWAEVAGSVYRNSRTAMKNGGPKMSRQAILQETMRIIQERDGEIFDNALIRALEYTWQNEPIKLASGMIALRKQLGPAAQFVIPFVTTPMNILTQGLRMSPLGVIGMIRKSISGKGSFKNEYRVALGDKEFASDLAEQVLAWTITAFLIEMVGDDDDKEKKNVKITGGASSFAFVARGKSGMERQVLPPLSIKIGDNIVSYANMEPLASILPPIVDSLKSFKQLKAGQEPLEALAEAWGRTILALSDKTFMGNLGDLIDASDNPDVMQRYASNFASSFTPSIIRSTVRAMDPLTRDMTFKGKRFSNERINSVLQVAASQAVPAEGTPWARNPKVDIWGRDIIKAGTDNPTSSLMYKLSSFAGLPVSKQADHRLTQMILDWNDIVRYRYSRTERGKTVVPEAFYVTPPQRVFDGIALDDDEYYSYSKNIGNIALSLAKNMHVDYDNPRPGDIRLLRKYFERARTAANSQLRAKLRRKSLEAK